VTTDPFAHDDAAYLLGALSPSQRRAFEEHMEHCPECSRSVREVAGVPGLLSRLPEEAFTGSVEQTPVPDTLLPSLLREVGRRRRRTRVVAALGVAAALVVGALVAVPLLDGGDGSGSEPPPATQAQEMTRVGQDVLTASVALEQVDWGTRLRLTCRYESGESGWGAGAPQAPSYALVVRTRDGESQQVATWRALADRTTTIDAATDADADDIAALDVTVTGTDRKVLTVRPAAS
jgi:hypothetical protein